MGWGGVDSAEFRDSAIFHARFCKIWCNSQNLHYSPSLRDFATQNRGNPLFFLILLDCFVVFASLKLPRNDEMGADSAIHANFAESILKLQNLI
ncbi:hypothetical protein [Helicobacter sp. 23-1045]